MVGLARAVATTVLMTSSMWVRRSSKVMKSSSASMWVYSDRWRRVRDFSARNEGATQKTLPREGRQVSR